MRTRARGPSRARCLYSRSETLKERHPLGAGSTGPRPGTCEADGAGARVVLAAEHAARAPVEAGGRGVAGVGGGVLAVVAREARGALARGSPQQGLGHTRATVLTAVPLAGVSMLAVLAHEALGTPAWERAESVKTPAAAETLPDNAVRSGRRWAVDRDAGSLGQRKCFEPDHARPRPRGPR